MRHPSNNVLLFPSNALPITRNAMIINTPSAYSQKPMTQTAETHRNRRIFPNVNWTEAEKQQRNAEQQARWERCYPVFEKLRSELIQNHYNWYLTIEPETGEYFLDCNSIANLKKARKKYPHSIFCTFGINETGVSGKI